MASLLTISPGRAALLASRLRARTVLTGAAVAVVTALLPAVVPAQAATAVPRTVPALRQWTPASGGFVLAASTRVLVDPAYTASLDDDARQFAADLGLLTGTTPAVATGTPAGALAGDIVLTLGSTDSQLGDEGYSLTSGPALTIKARTDTGAFYGTRSVLQLLRQSPSVPGGTARDWATKSERGLMVDVGRKYFTLDWLRQEIREMAHLKMNYLHLHLSDDKGFRIESTTHPEVVSAQRYSKREIADLIAYAARYHIMVVPEIDAPGHMAPVITPTPNCS